MLFSFTKSNELFPLPIVLPSLSLGLPLSRRLLGARLPSQQGLGVRNDPPSGRREAHLGVLGGPPVLHGRLLPGVPDLQLYAQPLHLRASMGKVRRSLC